MCVKLLGKDRSWVSRIGGALLITIGILLVTGEWNHLIIELQTHIAPGSGFEI